MAGSGTVNERSQTVHTPITGIAPIRLTTRRFRCRILHSFPYLRYPTKTLGDGRAEGFVHVSQLRRRSTNSPPCSTSDAR